MVVLSKADLFRYQRQVSLSATIVTNSGNVTRSSFAPWAHLTTSLPKGEVVSPMEEKAAELLKPGTHCVERVDLAAGKLVLKALGWTFKAAEQAWYFVKGEEIVVEREDVVGQNFHGAPSFFCAHCRLLFYLSRILFYLSSMSNSDNDMPYERV